MSNIPLNIPNILSLYRLISSPVILLFIWLGYQHTFVALFIVNQLTDILDGYIARKYHLQTEVGARLDSLADIGSYTIAFFAILKFHPYLFTDYGYWLSAFCCIYLLQILICRLRYGQWVAGLHLYSLKITGYIQGLFLVVLFAFGLVNYFFYGVIIFGMAAETEAIIINLWSPKPLINAKGLYWVLREKRWLKNSQTL